MKKITLYISLLLSSIVFFACEDTIELDVPEGPKRLVIDGNMTTLDGPQTVTIIETQDYNNQTDNPFVSNAIVKITDNQGNEFPLQYTEKGIYETNASVKGILGNEYTLFITYDGNEYKSSAQKMNAVTPIDSILNFHKEELTAGPFFQEAYFAAIEFTENGDTEDDVYRWKLYVNDTLQSKARDITVATDENLQNGVEFKEDDFLFQNRPLKVGDEVYIEQMAITEEAGQFWLDLSTQASNSGGLFDTPPAPIKGNIINVNDEKDVVLGFFGTENVVSSEKMIIEDRGFVVNIIDEK